MNDLEKIRVDYEGPHRHASDVIRHIPALCDEVERLRAEKERLDKDMDSAASMQGNARTNLRIGGWLDEDIDKLWEDPERLADEIAQEAPCSGNQPG